MKIKTSLVHRIGKKVSYGEHILEFDKTGVAEVTQEVADSIMSTDNSLSVFDESEAPKNDVIEEDLENNPELSENGVEEGDVVEGEAIDLSTMTVKELQAIAKEAKLPNAEWQSLKKDDLIKYLESKTGE